MDDATSSKTQAKHTPEPWKLDARRYGEWPICSHDGLIIGGINGEANAKRVIQLVNACAPDGAVTTSLLNLINEVSAWEQWDSQLAEIGGHTNVAVLLARVKEARAALALLRSES